MTALALAHARGLDFGTDVLWTYGPLGFLAYPQVTEAKYAVIAAVYTLLVQFGLGVTLVWAARRSFPLVGAFVLALLAAMLTAEPVLVAVLIWCVVVLDDDAPPLAARLLPTVAGIVGAIELLDKVNIGLAVLVIAAITVIAMDGPRRRNIAAFVADFVIAFAVLWFVTGQGVGDLGDFIGGSIAIIAGYSTAMALERDDSALLYAWSLAILAVSIGAAYLGSRGLPPRRRIASIVVVAVTAFMLWKQAVVRHEDGRVDELLSVLIATLFAFRWRGALFKPGRPVLTSPEIAAFVVVVFGALYFPLAHARVADHLNPFDNAKQAATDVRDLVLPGPRDRLRDQTRATLAAAYGIDPQTLTALDSKTVDVQPWETNIAWAYGLNWRPAPIFQSYGAYTSSLDERNADRLSAPDGPERILRHATTFPPNAPPSVSDVPVGEEQAQNLLSIDNRFGAFDAPEQTLASLCHFRPLRVTRPYLVLGRTANRCGPEHPIGSRTVGYNETVRVPRAKAPSEVVLARVHGLEPSGVERLRAFAFRAAIRTVVFNGSAEYRITPGTADDGLILDAPSDVDFPRPFAVSPQAQTIEFRKDSSVLSPSGDLTVDFLALPVRPR